MNVILSIKPKYVNEIVEGRKKYEFRKSIFSNDSVKNIIIYSSSPQKKIVGFFEIGKIISDHPERIWELTKGSAGISENDFFKYFAGSKIGYAIEIKKLEIFSIPIDPYESSNKFVPPQSFSYLHSNFIPELSCLS